MKNIISVLKGMMVEPFFIFFKCIFFLKHIFITLFFVFGVI